jgi:hypothetical protein
MRHRRRLAAGLALVLGVLAGCTGEDRHPPTPVLAAPPVDGLPYAAPVPAVLATVDLSPAVPGLAATPTAAVGAPDGGAFVLLSSPDLGLPHYLTMVSRNGSGYAITGSVPIPRLRPVWDLHALANGTVLVSGQFRGDPPGYGFLSVDPPSGTVSRTVVIPFEEGTDLAHGSSVLSPDEKTITLFLSSFTDGRQLDLLMSADTSTGRFRDGRDLYEEVRAVSETGIGPWSTWLFARPDGGVDLVFDAYPRGAGIVGVPTLMRYDDALEPVGGPLSMAGVADAARLRAAATTPDGTVFVRLDVPDGTSLIELPPSGSSRIRALDLPESADDDALVVDRAGAWALVPAVEGARAVDLATGGSTPVDVGCAPGVDQLLPGLGGASALMLGRCGPRGAAVPTLWIMGPTQ